MADEPKIKINQLGVYENLPNNNELVVYQGDSSGDRREKRIPPSEVGVLKGSKLNTFRTAFLEKSEVLSTTGWYKIAKLNSGGSTKEAIGSINIGSRFVSGGCDFSLFDPSNIIVKDRNNQFFELKRNTAGQGIAFRLAKSDTVDIAGMFIEAYIVFSSAEKTNIQLVGNTGRIDEAGIELIDPVLSDGLCPDGITASTFLEAGEELSFDNASGGAIMFPDISGHRTGNDQIKCVVLFTEIPKKGTGLTLTLPSSTLRFYDGAGNNTTVTGAHTISNFTQDGKHVIFYVNETNIGLGLSNSTLSLRVDGTGMKLIITG